MKISEAKKILRELDAHQMQNIRIEFKNNGDLGGSINRVLSCESQIIFLYGWTEEMAVRSLGEEVSDDLMEQADNSLLITYFDTEAYGRDLILGGDFGLVFYDNQFYGVSNH